MAPSIGEDFVRWTPPTGGDETLGMVDFAMFPHLDHEDLPDNSMADAERWAAGMPVPAYAIDDQTAIKVVDGTVDSRLRGALEALCPRRPSGSAMRSRCLAPVAEIGWARNVNPKAQMRRWPRVVRRSRRRGRFRLGADGCAHDWHLSFCG